MHRTEDVGYWKVNKCSDPLSYICESPRQGYTEPPTTTTTIKPEARCPGIDSDSVKYNGHCYKVYQDFATGDQNGLNFDQARLYCQTQYGGDLVSFGDQEEEKYVSDYSYGKDSWIGFRQESEVVLVAISCVKN